MLFDRRQVKRERLVVLLDPRIVLGSERLAQMSLRARPAAERTLYEAELRGSARRWGTFLCFLETDQCLDFAQRLAKLDALANEAVSRNRGLFLRVRARRSAEN